MLKRAPPERARTSIHAAASARGALPPEIRMSAAQAVCTLEPRKSLLLATHTALSRYRCHGEVLKWHDVNDTPSILNRAPGPGVGQAELSRPVHRVGDVGGVRVHPQALLSRGDSPLGWRMPIHTGLVTTLLACPGSIMPYDIVLGVSGGAVFKGGAPLRDKCA